MDKRQHIIKKTFTKKQLEGMTVKDLIALVGVAGPGAKFAGTGVVRKKDGTIRYDEDAVPGEYFETPEDLKCNADTKVVLESPTEETS